MTDDTWDTQARLRRLLDLLDRLKITMSDEDPEAAPLGKVLRSIARVYLDKPATEAGR